MFRLFSFPVFHLYILSSRSFFLLAKPTQHSVKKNPKCSPRILYAVMRSLQFLLYLLTDPTLCMFCSFHLHTSHALYHFIISKSFCQLCSTTITYHIFARRVLQSIPPGSNFLLLRAFHFLIDHSEFWCYNNKIP